MATTTLTLNSNRLFDTAFLRGNLASVALDAQIAEAFILPSGFGQLIIVHCTFSVFSLSGAYVAVAPATEGVQVDVQSADASTTIDSFGSARFVHAGTSSARPTLTASFDLQNVILMRQQDRILVSAPVLAGAGVTGTVQLYLRGRRIMTA